MVGVNAEVLRANLPGACRESPPTQSEHLIQCLSEVRGVPEQYLAASSGSSSIMFTVLPRLLDSRSRVLILDPTYGEYKHLLKNVIGCTIDHLPVGIPPEPASSVLSQLRKRTSSYSMVILVNPNSPTGTYLELVDYAKDMASAAPNTIVWVDETYLEYLGEGKSLEQHACAESGNKNLLVCKSMSKCYALSGLRVAYLCGQRVPELRHWFPPWSVGLPAQLAATQALRDPDYYARCYKEVHANRERLLESLRSRGFYVIDGCANFFVLIFPEIASSIVDLCKAEGVYLRSIPKLASLQVAKLLLLSRNIVHTLLWNFG